MLKGLLEKENWYAEGGEKNLKTALKEYVEHKFFYAGGSSRWMFELTIEEIEKAVKEGLPRQKDALNPKKRKNFITLNDTDEYNRR